MLHSFENRLQVLQADFVGEIPSRRCRATVSELSLHDPQIVGGFPHFLGTGSPQIVDAKFISNGELPPARLRLREAA